VKFNKDNLFISFVDESMKKYFFNNSIEYNVELVLFCLPEILNGPWREVVKRVKNVFKRYPVRRHMHGPFIDLPYHSRDQEVCALAKRKIIQGLTIAEEIGAEHIVFHSTYNPLVVDSRYPRSWNQRALEFWLEIIPYAERSGCIMVIENVFDPYPEIIKGLVKKINSPYFKACLDVGHAHIFGKVGLEQWVKILKNDLVHLHIHDNSKVFDEHYGLGKGTINFKRFFTSIEKEKIDPSFTLEVRDDKEMRRSFRYLKSKGYWE